MIAELIKSRVAAVKAKDVEALMAPYAEDVVVFDVVGPISDRGIEAERARLEQWFGSYRTEIELEIKDLEIAEADGLAFAHYLFHIQGTLTDDTEVSMWVRSTTCLRDTSDGWKIVHEHSSAPQLAR